MSADNTVRSYKEGLLADIFMLGISCRSCDGVLAPDSQEPTCRNPDSARRNEPLHNIGKVVCAAYRERKT
jgi:hypothetical protein